MVPGSIMGTVLDKERTAQFYIMSDEADATVEGLAGMAFSLAWTF